MKLKKITAALAAASLFTLTGPVSPTFAANHPLSTTSNTVANGVEYVDLTVNVDWNFGSPPKHFNDTNITLNQTYIVRPEQLVSH